MITVDFGWHPVLNPTPGEPTQVWVEGAWEYSELDTVLHAVGALADVMGGAGAFRETMGGTKIAKGLTFGNEGMTWTPYFITLADNPSEWTVVHELAYTWDYSTRGRLSTGLEAYTGGVTVLRWRGLLPRPQRQYQYGGTPAKGADASFNRQEDFAESVTAFVYPGKAQADAQLAQTPSFYENYYILPRAVYVARQLNMSPREFRFWQWQYAR